MLAAGVLLHVADFDEHREWLAVAVDDDRHALADFGELHQADEMGVAFDADAVVLQDHVVDLQGGPFGRRLRLDDRDARADQPFEPERLRLLFVEACRRA